MLVFFSFLILIILISMIIISVAVSCLRMPLFLGALLNSIWPIIPSMAACLLVLVILAVFSIFFSRGIASLVLFLLRLGTLSSWRNSTSAIMDSQAHTAPIRGPAILLEGFLLQLELIEISLFGMWIPHIVHIYFEVIKLSSQHLCFTLNHSVHCFSLEVMILLRVWDLNQKKYLHILEKQFFTVTSLAISEDKLALLRAGRDKVVNIWDLEDYGLRARTPTLESLECVCSVPSSSNLLSLGKSKNVSSGKQKKVGAEPMHFLTVGEHGIICIWYSEGAICLYEQKSTVKDEMKGGFISAMLLPSNQGVMCVTRDRRFLFYDSVETLNGNYEVEITRILIGCNEEINDLNFHGDEERSLAVATNVEQVAANAIGRMRSLIIFPIIPFIILAIFYIWRVAAALNLFFGAGEIRQNQCDAG